MTSLRTGVLLAVSCILLSSSGAYARSLPPLKPKPYQIGIAPSHITTSNNPLLESSAQWPKTAAGIDLYKYYGIQMPGVKHSNRITPVDPKNLVALMKREHVELGCEFGSFPRRDKTGEKAIQNAFEQIDPVFEAGGKVSSIHLDGPVRRQLKGIFPDGKSLDEITANLVKFYKALHAKYPQLEIGLITNFPNWDYTRQLPGYVGGFTAKSGLTYLQVLNTVYKALNAAGQKIAFIEVDCPYNYFREKRSRRHHAAMDNPRKFRELQKWCEQRNIRFHVIINAQVGSGRAFHDMVLKYIRQLRKDGIFPDLFLIQSWYTHPSTKLPESKPDTFMNTARDAISLIHSLYPSAPSASQ